MKKKKIAKNISGIKTELRDWLNYNWCLPSPYVPVIPLAFLLYQSILKATGSKFRQALYYLR
jgi:hypothetical protein